MNEKILEARYTHQEIVRKYNLIASVYDLFAILMVSKAQQRALEMAAIRNGEKVLEVAFGTGLNFIEILKRNPEDASQESTSQQNAGKNKEADSEDRAQEHTLHLGDCRRSPLKMERSMS